MNKYYSLYTTGREANITIYGDITSFPWLPGDVSADMLSKQIEELDVDVINVHINSYGGEVAEGWAIYNALRSHPAKIHTCVDGFACSIASVIFMAGEERTMSDISLLMIHNPWTRATGNAEELKKAAEDLEKMGELSAKAYLRCVNITEDELQQLLDAESWIAPDEAVEKGFATDVVTEEENGQASQSCRRMVFDRITAKPQEGHTLPSAEELAVQVAKKLTAMAEAMTDRPQNKGQNPGHEPEPTPAPGHEPAPVPEPQENKVLNIFTKL